MVRSAPTWCARCDEVLQSETEWNRFSERFAGFTLRCSGCYDELRARNQWAPATAEEGSFGTCECGAVHTTLPTNFSVGIPALPADTLARAKITTDTCEIDDDRLVRACLEIPVIGGAGPLVYGVWVSLSQTSSREFVDHLNRARRYCDGPSFGWLMSALPVWPRRWS